MGGVLKELEAHPKASGSKCTLKIRTVKYELLESYAFTTMKLLVELEATVIVGKILLKFPSNFSWM